MTRRELDQELLATAVANMGDDRLAAVRSAALAKFAGTGLPAGRDEDWRYTNIEPVIDIGNRWLSAKSADTGGDRAQVDYSAIADAHWLEIRNGQIDHESLAKLTADLDGQATVSLVSGGAELPAIDIDEPFSSLNAALLSDVLHIRLAENARVEKPIALAYIDDEPDGWCHSRLLIDAAAHSDAALIEWHYTPAGLTHAANIVTQVELGAGARLRAARIQERGDQSAQIGRVIANLAADSSFEHMNIDLGGQLIRNDVAATLVGPGSRFSTAGTYLTDGRQHVDNHLCADHAVGPASSRQNYRGIASGNSRCVFNGKAIVREGADGTDAEQSNHNLLLSERAEIDTKPELEIYADDVKCSHGATIGQLDRQALYYLRTRGLGIDDAARMLTRAFVAQIIAEIPIEGARQYIETRIDQRLDTLTGGDIS